MVFEFYNVQAGMDHTGVPTKMLSINSTVRIKFRNTATFFGVHVTSTPLELYYSDLKVASGQVTDLNSLAFGSNFCPLDPTLVLNSVFNGRLMNFMSRGRAGEWYRLLLRVRRFRCTEAGRI